MSLTLAALVIASLDTTCETRTLQTGPGEFECIQRIVSGKEILMTSKTITASGCAVYSTSLYSLDGSPLNSRQEGSWNDRWNVFETTFGINEAVQAINGVATKTSQRRADYRSPNVLWFWKTHPKVGEAVNVKFLAQNRIATFAIKFTYEGDEEMTLLGRKELLHRVREDPKGTTGVYTLCWYDSKGMRVRRYHKTPTNEYWFELNSWR